MNRSPLHWLTSDISQWDPDICHKISWKTSQASRLYSLVTEVDQPGICGDIWNHHSVSSIVHILWAAKCTHHKKGQMVCCWKGMENLQCGSQNHHVCHIAWLKAYLHYLWWAIGRTDRTRAQEHYLIEHDKIFKIVEQRKSDLRMHKPKLKVNNTI